MRNDKGTLPEVTKMDQKLAQAQSLVAETKQAIARAKAHPDLVSSGYVERLEGDLRDAERELEQLEAASSAEGAAP